jgi:hypothetical protein
MTFCYFLINTFYRRDFSFVLKYGLTTWDSFKVLFKITFLHSYDIGGDPRMHLLQFMLIFFRFIVLKRCCKWVFVLLAILEHLSADCPFHYNSAHHILLISAHSTKFYKTSQSRETVSFMKTHMYLFGLWLRDISGSSEESEEETHFETVASWWLN